MSRPDRLILAALALFVAVPAVADSLLPPAELEAGYPEWQLRDSALGGTTDPADVPRAIAEIIAMPAGTRPLRRAVHPGPKPHEAINRVSAEVQRQVLGRGQFAPWAEAVLD